LKFYKKIIELVVWVLILMYLILVLGFVSDMENEVTCKKIDVKIIDKTENQFVESADIISLFKQHENKILGYPFDSIRISDLEELILKEQHSVKNAEIFTTIDGKLNIHIKQRNPIMRIINYNNSSYYVDNEGALMSLSKKYSAHVLIANGNINEPYNLRYTTNVFVATENDELGRGSLLFDLYTLSNFIYNDPFWKAQIQQIYVLDNNNFELIPKVGDHIIEFGGIDNYKEKFRNLMLMYQKGFRAEGWNKYKSINLKYKNQVVCLKK